MERSIAGYFLILAGVTLIFLRAREKGDIKLQGGIWGVIGKIGDATYIVGVILVIVGAALIDESIIQLFTDGNDNG